MRGPENIPVPARELSVSFGYQCSNTSSSSSVIVAEKLDSSSEVIFKNSNMKMTSGSFSCLSGAALSANTTLANTNICSGLIGEEILPSLESPKSFRRMASSPSLSQLDHLSSSSHGTMTSSGVSVSTENNSFESKRNLWKSMSAPARTDSSSFLNAMDIQMAGGAAGEDRVQAVCSEENGWLFCGIYDGFNGRDAADFLAGTLYENIGCYLHLLEWRTKKKHSSFKGTSLANETTVNAISLAVDHHTSNSDKEEAKLSHTLSEEFTSENFHRCVLDCLNCALAQAENDFMYMVEQEMEDHPDLVSVGSSVLAVLLHGNGVYILNLGDSRAVLAMNDVQEDGAVKVIQLTEIHTVDNELECTKVLADHLEDPLPIINGRVKGKLKLTRAFGVGYLKNSKMNDVLMGILRVRNLSSPPYVYTQPFTMSHRMSKNDQFIVLGSDGLYDFFGNDEVVQLVHLFI